MRSISRLTVALGLADPLRRGVGLAGEDLELAANRGQRRAQLVRGVGDEAALAGKGILEPVEHVVERLRQGADLVAGALGPDPAVELAGVHLGCDPRHPPQRRRGAGGEQVAGDQRRGQGQGADQEEGAGDLRLGPLDRFQRLPRPDHRQPARPPARAIAWSAPGRFRRR